MNALTWKEWRENRNIVAAIASLTAVLFILEAVALLILSNGSNMTDDFGPSILPALVALVIVSAAPFAICYKIFTKGKTLNTGTRFEILRGYLVAPAVIVSALVIAVIIIIIN